MSNVSHNSTGKTTTSGKHHNHDRDLLVDTVAALTFINDHYTLPPKEWIAKYRPTGATESDTTIKAMGDMTRKLLERAQRLGFCGSPRSAVKLMRRLAS